MTNPTRPQLLPASADSLARVHTAEAMGVVVGIMRGQILDHPAVMNARLKAAQAVIDRGHGRAVQAVISVPARHAVAARVAAMTDEALLALAQRGRGEGSTGENEGPIGSHPDAGTIQRASGPLPTEGLHSAQALLPHGISAEDVEEAEFEEEDDFDPCS